MYCLGCGYEISHSTSGTCPECGGAFDLLDPTTFRVNPRAWWEGWRDTLPQAVILVYAAGVGVHAVGTMLGDPWGLRFDWTLWVTLWPLKAAALVSVIVILGWCYGLMANRPRLAFAAFASWAVSGATTVALLAIFRDRVAEAISNDQIIYLVTYELDIYDRATPWTPRWGSGEVVALEAILVIGLAAIHAALGFAAGAHRVVREFLGVGVTVAILITYALSARLMGNDFDDFHGDIVSGALTHDLLIPIAPFDPYTWIATPFYLYVLVTWRIVRKLSVLPDPGSVSRAMPRTVIAHRP